MIAPSIRYLERAYDAAKYGEMSTEPYLEITTSGPRGLAPLPVRAVCVAPRRLGSDAPRARNACAIDTLRAALPAIQGARSARCKSLTPLDLEKTYGLTEGDLNHGQLILDQMFFMRPMPGWSNHNTPIDGLYLCGNGVHGGGGISGASGRNAARALLKG